MTEVKNTKKITQYLLGIMSNAVRLVLSIEIYSGCVALIMLLYAGFVTCNVFLLLIPCGTVFIAYMVGRWAKKKNIIGCKKKIHTKISIALSIVSIICYTSAFIIDYVYERPTVEEINELSFVEYLSTDISETYDDLLHSFNVAQLRMVSETNALMREIKELAEDLRYFSAIEDPSAEEESEMTNYIAEAQKDFSEKQSKLEDYGRYVTFKKYVSLFLKAIASYLWVKSIYKKTVQEKATDKEE